MPNTTPMKLVTIVTEGLLKDQMTDLLKRHKTTGYTMSRVQGEGSRGVHASEWEGPSYKIVSIVSPETADEILDEISEKYFDDYAVVAWLTDISVLRGEKFSQRDESF